MDRIRLNDRIQIARLVDAFYGKVQQDEHLSKYFNEVAKVNWDKHLPRMVNFWDNILLGSDSYNGQPMATHFELHKKEPLHHESFRRWVELFEETVDELFTGEEADHAKVRARQIAQVMGFKILGGP